MTATILVVDDEGRMREVLALAVKGMGYDAVTAGTGTEALTVLDQAVVDLVLTDIRMPEMDGEELLRQVRIKWPTMPVVLMTAHGSYKDAVAAIKQGAYDYVAKPFDMDELEVTLANALHYQDVVRENRRLRSELAERAGFGTLIGESEAFAKVLREVAEVSESRSNVLITGESGTGKELVARAVHASGKRHDRPFVAVNCAAIPENLLESELFGHVKGAFTGALANRVGRFQQADTGTLFLDEIGDMALPLQAKILRVLQEQVFEPVGSNKSQKVDVRIIAATNKVLTDEIRSGSFREDLYYRLNVFPIDLPPLRTRKGDIPLLAAHFLTTVGRTVGKRVDGFSPGALSLMQAYSWPGNIRELQNCVERAIIVARAPIIEASDLPAHLAEEQATQPNGVSGGLPSDLDADLERIEREYILRALDETGGVQVKAAELLGIAERSLWHRIKKLNIRITKQSR